MVTRRVIFIQQGARRNYVYAEQLERAALLHSLLTDAAWTPGSDRLTRLAARVLPRLLGPVGRRTVRGVPPERLKASFWPNISGTLLSSLHPEQRFALMDEALAWRSRLRGLHGADIVVNYHGNGGSFLDYAKSRGARIVTDFIITPKHLEIEQSERVRWPGWEVETTPQSVMDRYRRRMSWLTRISDIYLCPSETVARDLADLPGFDSARVRYTPYGLSGVLVRNSGPLTGRVLFAGTAGLRKGLPYLATAATILKARAPLIKIVIAGHASDLVRARPETQDLTFLGVLDRGRMADEFARADMFCMPSLAEGSATSIFEAMANGLPIVTTNSAGSVVSDGVEGLIVPERDAMALADAIERITADRGMRERMSRAALATAARFDDNTCGQRFLAVISELTGQPVAVAG